jgi:hypothetical protein
MITVLTPEEIAIKKWNAGIKPSFSTGVCESLTCGYGILDDSGYWEFPLYPAEQYLTNMHIMPPDSVELQLRKLLALQVAGAMLYTDDGELQDSSKYPFIDFLRDSPEKIEAALFKRAVDGIQSL